MTKPNTSSLSKICSICGIQKPLAAFLQFSGSGGATYGNVCYSCRKANRDKLKKIVEEDAGRSESGHKIDAKTRVKSETDKRDKRELIKEQYEEERDLKKHLTQKSTDKKTAIESKERDHRETHLQKPAEKESKKAADMAAANKSFFAYETAKTKIDYATGPVIDTQFAGKLKHQSSIYNTFKSWLGTSAPIVGNAEKLANAAKTAPPTVEKPTGPGKKR